MTNTAIDTSLVAYDAAKATQITLEERIALVVATHTGGISRTQIAAALDEYEITVGARITRMLAAGKLRRKGETVTSTNGKPEHLYVLGDGVPVKKTKASFTVDELAQAIDQITYIGSVSAAFPWNRTRQGFDFWQQVHRKVEDLREQRATRYAD